MTRAAGGESPLATLRQSIGRLPLLIRNMAPTWSLDHLGQLDPAFIARHDIAGVIWDIDGTLTAYHAKRLLPGAEGPFAALRALPGLRHAILSNAPEWRFRELAVMFPGIPVLRGYLVAGTVIGRRLVGSDDSWTAGELDHYLAQGAMTLRKPNADLVRLAITELGCPAEAVVMVGDQYLTDVAGANLAGVRSVKLPNPAPRSFPWSIRFTQQLEKLLFRLRSRTEPISPPGRTPDAIP